MNKLKGHEHYNNTFDKLYIFECDDYDKLIYVDSDMLILKNIDNLFENSHMSAAIAGKSYIGNESWRGLNSGLMVIEPNKELTEKLIKLIPKVTEKKEMVGDQDILQEYYSDWGSLNLEIQETYNLFYTYIDFHIKNNFIH